MTIWLIKFLIFGHVHRWETVEEQEIVNVHKALWSSGQAAPSFVSGKIFIQKCSTCGKMNSFRCEL